MQTKNLIKLYCRIARSQYFKPLLPKIESKLLSNGVLIKKYGKDSVAYSTGSHDMFEVLCGGFLVGDIGYFKIYKPFVGV